MGGWRTLQWIQVCSQHWLIQAPNASHFGSFPFFSPWFILFKKLLSDNTLNLLGNAHKLCFTVISITFTDSCDNLRYFELRESWQHMCKPGLLSVLCSHPAPSVRALCLRSPYPNHVTKWHFAIWISKNDTIVSEESTLKLNLKSSILLKIPITMPSFHFYFLFWTICYFNIIMIAKLIIVAILLSTTNFYYPQHVYMFDPKC